MLAMAFVTLILTQPPTPSCAQRKIHIFPHYSWNGSLTGSRADSRSESWNGLSNAVAVPGELVLDDCDSHVGGVRRHPGR